MDLRSKNSLVKKLSGGELMFGTCITSSAPRWPSIIQNCGLDFVFIDTEHIALNRVEVSSLCHQYKSRNIVPIVRVPSPDPFLACQAIDGGASGVVFPYIESVEQVQQLVGATKLRPLKGQKLSTVLKGEEIPTSLSDYLEKYNSENICILNIESVPALENLDALLNTPGIDGVFIGPHDLSVSMGFPEQYDHPDFCDAVRTIIKICRAKNIFVGIHLSLEPQRQIDWVREGANLVVHSSDMALFSQRLLQDFDFIKKKLGINLLSTEPGSPTI